MFKKIFLITSLFITFSPEKTYSLNNQETAAIIIGAGVIGTTICCARETNDSLIFKARELIHAQTSLSQETEPCLNQELLCMNSDITAAEKMLAHKVAQLSVLQEKLSEIYNVIKGRYNSYVTPWNWTEKMFAIMHESKSAMDSNQKQTKSVNNLLQKIVYLRNLQLYQKILQYIINFIQEYHDSLEQKFICCESDNRLLSLFNQKKSIERELNQFFAKHKILQSEWQKSSNLNFSDRNIEIETEVSVLFQKAVLVNTILKYSNCIVSAENNTNLIFEIRKKMGTASSYPIKDFISLIEHEIENLYKLSLISTACSTEFCIEILQNLKNTVIASNDYIAERRAYEIYLEQQRQVEAAMRAAKAAEDAAQAAKNQARAIQETADATFRQARAIEEQNRLKKEENRINEERNTIERNKHQNNRSNNDNRNNNDRW